MRSKLSEVTKRHNQFRHVPTVPQWTAGRVWLLPGGTALLAALLLVSGCSLGSSHSTTPVSTSLTAAQVPWCDTVSIAFIDNGSATDSTLTDWQTVSAQLGFTPYLPDSFPKGTCLVLAGGSIHDPVYGGHLSITWNVAGDTPLSFSEAPKRANLGNSLQCAQSSQQATTSICLGTVGDTGITVASSQSIPAVQAVFKTLKPNVNWVPADTNQLLASPTATATASS
ncbi:MAG: hypothetical protein ACLQUY_06680 [Ktedonobacterales bacterium]